jgi:hypothetical protein
VAREGEHGRRTVGGMRAFHQLAQDSLVSAVNTVEHSNGQPGAIQLNVIQGGNV